MSEPTTVLDSNGNEIASFYVENRESVTVDQVSPYVLKGTVATEDERFYEHNGVDLIGIARAVVVQLTGGSEGASTITQQLVRNTILSEEQFDNTIERKVREAFIAIKMEEVYSKEEILMMYLNTIYYGHGAYGIQTASKTYFSKSAADLTLAEAALLIGLPNAPSVDDPTVNPDYALSRRNTVLTRMASNGVITEEEAEAAKAEPITLNLAPAMPESGTLAYPYFVDYVKSLLREEFTSDMIFEGGLTVKTDHRPDPAGDGRELPPSSAWRQRRRRTPGWHHPVLATPRPAISRRWWAVGTTAPTRTTSTTPPPAERRAPPSSPSPSPPRSRRA